MTEFNLPASEKSANENGPAGGDDFRRAWVALQTARGGSEKEAAILHAMSLGVALSEIEALLDWLDTEAKAQTSAAQQSPVQPPAQLAGGAPPSGAGRTLPIPAPPKAWSAPHFRPRQPPGDSFA